MCTWTHVYPDTRAGALGALAWMSNLKLRGARAFPDPVVEGVWGVDLKDGRRAIVYLAGYKDPWGTRRTHNDFEVEGE